MAALDARLAALATRIGNVVRDGLALKADDSATVHKSGDETVNGTKTFGTAPLVPIGALLANPVRRDDSRLTDSRTPTAHKSSHATGGTDALAPSDIGAQPADPDLTAIAALTATTDNVIQSVAGAWASRTPAQVRTTLAVQPTSEKGAANGYAPLDAAGLVPSADMPLVLGSPVAVTLATTAALDASAGSVRNVQSSTATLAVSVPTTPAERQVLRCAFKRSTAAALTVNFNASIRLTTGITTRAWPLASGEVLLCALEYSSLVGAWALTACTVVAAS